MTAGCRSLCGRMSVNRLSWETPRRASVCLSMCKCMLKSGLPAAYVTMCKHAKSSPQPPPPFPSILDSYPWGSGSVGDMWGDRT